MKKLRIAIYRFLTIKHPEPDVRLRARNLLMITLGLSFLTVVQTLIWGLQRDYSSAITAAIIGIISLICFFVARNGYVSEAAIALLLMITISIEIQILVSREIANGGFFLIAPLVFAAITTTPRIFGITWIALLSSYWLIAWVLAPVTFGEIVHLNAFQSSSMLLFFIGLIGLVSTLTLRQNSREVATARTKSEQTAAKLAQTNSELEQRVNERTSELAQLVAREQTQANEFQRLLEHERELNEVINALSLPILPVRPDVLVAPLVGNIDDQRADRLLSQILAEIEQRRAHAVILDVTGVAVIDTQLAQSLLRVAAAAGLLGTRTVLVGIRPEVAQTLVSLGADLNNLETAATLYAGLRRLT